MRASRPPQATFHYSCPVEGDGWREIPPCSHADALGVLPPNTVLLTPVAFVGDLVWVHSITAVAMLVLVALPALVVLWVRCVRAQSAPPMATLPPEGPVANKAAKKKRSGSVAAKKLG